MKILHLLSQRPDSTGSGIYIQAMLREASSWGHENCLVAGIPSDWSHLLDCIDSQQCRFVRFGEAGIFEPIVGMSDVMPYPSRRWCDLSNADLDEYESVFSGILKAAVARFQPDLIHSHHLWIVSALARRLFPDIPMVTTCHGSDLRQFQNCPHLQQRVLDGCRRLDAIMALSEAQKADIARLYGLPPERVVVVGAGYDDRLFTRAPKPAPPPVRLVYAGKLSRAKGVPWLLRALARIDAANWQLHLVGGGSGPEKAECLRLAGELGQRVIVHGAMPQQELADRMKQSHIFVLPSFYEGLPLVLLESLACGCRLVATDLPGVQEILGDVQADFIRLVPTPRLRYLDQPYGEDEEGFERRLARALNEQIRDAEGSPRIDLSCLRRQMAAYTWRGVFEKVQAVYFSAAKT